MFLYFLMSNPIRAYTHTHTHTHIYGERERESEREREATKRRQGHKFDGLVSTPSK